MGPAPPIGGFNHQPGGHINFGGSTPISQALRSLLGQYTQSAFLSSRGLVYNQFRPTQSLHDQQLSNQYEEHQRNAAINASRFDQKYLSQLIGNDAFGKKSGTLDAISRMTAQLSLSHPDLVDRLYGKQGSATAMSQGMLSGLRYMRDGTGRDFDLKKAGDFTGSVFRNLYGANPRDMNGIGANRAGQMFDEMARRGTMQTPAEPGKVADRLQDMSKAVSAMRDVFGANGKSNASMKEIFDGLNSITQGSSHWMSGDSMGTMVRRVQGLSRNVQGGLERYNALSRQGGALAGMVGLDNAFGMQTAQSSMGFGKAFGQMAGRQGFGGLSMDEATASDQQLRTAAAGSGEANALGAFIDMANQGLFKHGSQALALANDLTGTDVAKKKAAMAHLASIPPGDFVNNLQGMATASGASDTTVSNFFNAGAANQEAVFRHGLGDVIRDLQGPGQINSMLNSSLQSGMMGIMGERFNGQEMQQLLPVAADAIRQTLQNMDPEVRSDPKKVAQRNALLIKAVSDAIGPDNVKRLGDKMNELVSSAVRSAEAMVANDPTQRKLFKNLSGMLTMNSRAVLDGGKQEVAKADKDGEDASKKAAINEDDDWIRRLSETVAGAGPDTDVTELIAKALGGVDPRELNPNGPAPRPPGGGAPPGGGGGGGGGGKDGHIRISGTLTLKDDGTADIDGVNAPGGAAAG